LELEKQQIEKFKQLAQLKNEKMILLTELENNQPQPLLLTENYDIEDSCVIYMDNGSVCACFPCGHKCMCQDCSAQDKINKCPICRAEIISVMRIY